MVNVNTISPGKMYDPTTLSENELKNKLANIPLRRFVEPQNIAEMALFLMTDKARNITGQNIIIDGGKTIL